MKTTGDDAILPFRLAKSNMRGRVVRLGPALETIIGQHQYPEPVSSLVAEAVLLTVLIGQTMKLRWRFSLQVRGDGPVKMIATDYFAPTAEGKPAQVRGYAHFDAPTLVDGAPPFEQMGKGVMGVTIDQGPRMTPYQGITPLAGGSLSACAETYFAQSEQIATRFVTISGRAQSPGGAPSWRAAGMMLQQMPEEGGAAPSVQDAPSGEDGLMTADDVAAMGAREEDWRRVNYLLATVEETELIGPHVSPEGLLTRLFHEEVPSVFPVQPVEFGCTCSAARVEAALAGYSRAAIAEMTTEDGYVTADCQFCGARYVFDPACLGREASASSG